MKSIFSLKLTKRIGKLFFHKNLKSKRMDPKMNESVYYRAYLILFILFFVFIGTSQLNSEICQTVSGEVVDEMTGKGIKNVLVKIFAMNDIHEVITDSNGKFVCYEVEPGLLQLKFFPPPPYVFLNTNQQSDSAYLEKDKNVFIYKKIKCGGKIHGRIYDKNSSEILDPIQIGIIGHFNEIIAGNNYLNNNYYNIGQINPGVHSLIINLTGYGPRLIDNIYINSCETKCLDIELDSNNLTKITGKVSCNNTNDPIRNYIVFLESVEAELTSSTYTDNDGEFIFKDVIPGNYILIVSCCNTNTNSDSDMYLYYKNNLVIYSGQTKKLNIKINCPCKICE